MRIEDIADREYRDALVGGFTRQDDGWTLELDDGRTLFVRRRADVDPSYVHRVRLYGRSGGSPRGVAFDGVVVYYDPPTSGEAENVDADAAYERYRREIGDRERRLAALPEPFRLRIEKLRRTREDSRWLREPLELAVAEAATRLAERYGARGVRRMLDGLDDAALWDALTNESASVDLAGASPHVVRFTYRLAEAYANDPAIVVLMHGVRALEVGCERYGCPHPIPIDLVPGGQRTIDRIREAIARLEHARRSVRDRDTPESAVASRRAPKRGETATDSTRRIDGPYDRPGGSSDE